MLSAGEIGVVEGLERRILVATICLDGAVRAERRRATILASPLGLSFQAAYKRAMVARPRARSRSAPRIRLAAASLLARRRSNRINARPGRDFTNHLPPRSALLILPARAGERLVGYTNWVKPEFNVAARGVRHEPPDCAVDRF